MQNPVGIDVSKDKLDILWLRDQANRKVKSKKLGNNPKGHEQTGQWLVKTLKAEPAEISVVMEATGIYHERLALYLYEQGFKVYVVNPARVKHFGKSQGIVHKTDKSDSIVLADYGVANEAKLILWQPEPAAVRKLKSLLSRLEALEKDIQREDNRLEKATSGDTTDIVIQSIQNVLKTLREEKERLLKEIDDHIDNEPGLKQNKKLLESIPGVADVTSKLMLSVILSRPFSKAGQVSNFLGVIPVLLESGKWKGHTKLSKEGSGYIRSKLYMAALSAKKYNPDVRALYERLLSRGKTKMQALGACMRKLTQICFGVIKHQSEYQPQTV